MSLRRSEPGARAWAWSSYQAHTAETEPPPWLDSAALHRRLAPGAWRRDGPAKYAEFVAQGKGLKLWDGALQGQIYLGNDAFVKRMPARIPAAPGRDISREQLRRTGRPLAHYFKQADRDQAIVPRKF